jgi:uncharacterized protein (TIGR02678 family)
MSVADVTTEAAGERNVSHAWAPEADRETAEVLRLLMVRPWLVAGRDDEAIAKVKRNLKGVRDAFGRLGWVVVVERDLVRLRKTPPARRPRPGDTAAASARAYQWFFLLVAAAEGMGRRVGLGSLVTAARAAAGEAGVAATGELAERRAIVAALRMLTERGVLEQLDGDIDGYVHDDDPPVLLAVHHTRLLHVIANYAGDIDPATDPAGWLEAVEREPDPARRRLVDDTAVHACDLDDAEADWLSRRVRADDGGPLAAAFGLHLERRSEGAAFVVGDSAYRHPWQLGPLPFPASGTVAHAALLVCNWAMREGETGGGIPPGWRAVEAAAVAAKLEELADAQASGSGGWARELTGDPGGRFLDEVRGLLCRLDMIRTGDGDRWLFAPVAARWPAPKPKQPRPAARPRRGADHLTFDFGDPIDPDLD